MTSGYLLDLFDQANTNNDLLRDFDVLLFCAMLEVALDLQNPYIVAMQSCESEEVVGYINCE